MARIKIGLVGIGKIARDQHVPALAADDGFELIATASRNGAVEGVARHATIDAMLAACPDLEAVSLCAPPGPRFEQALAAIAAGKHVMLEKPTAATLGAAQILADRARARGVSLFATWHSREAAQVDRARAWLAERRIDAVRIHWREDIRRWHPGQDWILAAGGFGVFDPGINAFSIATRILPDPLIVEAATLAIPANRVSPIAATVAMRSGAAPVAVDLDFTKTGEQQWDIEVDTDRGMLRLRNGGARLELPAAPAEEGGNAEYPRLYRAFADLIARGASDVDLEPLRLVADAFLLGVRHECAAFEF